MRVLWIATKPPLPPTDGGRLVSWTTLRALAETGGEVTLVAPVASRDEGRCLAEELAPWCRVHPVVARPRSRARALLRSAAGGLPYSVARHSLPQVAGAVAQLLEDRPFDVVHAEQLQALASAEPALRAGLPVVLRAQNVESDLWEAVARRQRLLAPWLRREARRLRRHEGRAVRRAAATVALSARDAEVLRELSGAADRVLAVPPPFPAELPGACHRLPGAPAVVLLGSVGWLPNAEGVDWFVRDLWPGVRERLPSAVLHLFFQAPGRFGARTGVRVHPPTADSRDAFTPGAVVVIPLRIASGVRMRILESWARGLPVVATPAAVAGLEARDGREVFLARDALELAEAVEVLTRDEETRGNLITAGRAALARHHDPGTVAARLLETYRRAMGPPNLSPRGPAPGPAPRGAAAARDGAPGGTLRRSASGML